MLIKQEAQKLLDVGSVKPIQYPTLVANITLIKKIMVKYVTACLKDEFSLPNIDMLVNACWLLNVLLYGGFQLL